MRLRLYGDEDLWLTEALETDPEVMAHLGGAMPREQIPAIHERRAKGTAEEGGFYVIIPDEESGAVGTVGIWTTQWDGETVHETGWMLLPAFQGRGIASRALAMVLDEAKAEGTVDAVHAWPSASNPGSNALCRKFGFELLGECDVAYAGPIHANHWRLDMTTYQPGSVVSIR